MRVINLIGQRIGRWTVICRDENTDKGSTRWICQCDCGNQRIVVGVVLRDGRSQSCGCLKLEQTIARSTKHGHSPEGNFSPTYHTWSGMLARCTNGKNRRYKDYGGRGIGVCERWYDFANFLADMGEKPKGYSLDRIDVNGDYEPGNCRWATATEQARNKRNNTLLTHNGETHTIAEWGDILGIRHTTISTRLHSGWSVERALTPHKTPKAEYRHNHALTYNGETLTLAEWARKTGIGTSAIYGRFHAGLPAEEILRHEDRRRTKPGSKCP